MSYKSHMLEEQLKEFLVDEQRDSYNVKSLNLYRYNNLKFSMNAKQYSQPHFIITLGISEAVYSISDCDKISGSLGPEDRYIYRWFGRANIKFELEELWK